MSNWLAREIKHFLPTFDFHAIKTVVVAFDPWRLDSRQTRDFLHIITDDGVAKNYPKMFVKPTVKSDLSDPLITVEFIDNTKAVFKAKNLTTLDILTKLKPLCQAKKPAD
ncbi:unnamed protein product [Didymodactylos carnosus]|nr:unnamed protein product [Didymodactylos carnosus]CAF4414067.1 unnamed protein product [Didymodactylos carnosus]